MATPGGQAANAPAARAAWLALPLLLLLAGCGGRAPPAGRSDAAAPYRLSGPACLKALAEHGVRATPWRAPAGDGCRVDTPVRAAAGGTAAFAPPLGTSCAMLVAWSDFEPQIQAAARARFGQGVAAVRHYGSVACRPMTGNARRPSLHASGRALDVAGFVLADGREVGVARGWSGPRDERRFLRDVAAAACRRFSVALTPESDRRHADHLHLDVGPWRACGGR